MTDQVEKAITLTQLKQKREQLVAQAQMISGAIMFLNQEIAGLEKPEPAKPEEVRNDA